MFDTLIESTTERAASGVVLDGLDDMRPGLFLAGILSSIDVADLSGYDRMVVLRAHQRMIDRHQARLHEAMMSIEDHCSKLFDGDLESRPTWPPPPRSARR